MRPMTDGPPLAPPAAPPRAPVRRHHWIVRLTHWATLFLVAGMITSGLQIYEAYARFGSRGGPFLPSPFDDARFPQWSRLPGPGAGAVESGLSPLLPPLDGGVRSLPSPPGRGAGRRAPLLPPRRR